LAAQDGAQQPLPSPRSWLPLQPGVGVLRELLARTEQISDLGALFSALGYTAVWERVPPASWLGESAEPGVRSAALVARCGAFRIFGLDTPNPDRWARRAAARLAER